MDAYHALLERLRGSGVAYRELEHAPEGRTDLVSALRGHAARHAAKCLVVMVKHGKKSTRFALAVIPGDYKLDTGALARLYGATYVGFASATDAERLTGCVPGTVLPIPLLTEMEVIADAALFESREMYFNAGRLDRSVAIATADYLRAFRPRVEAIAVRPALESAPSPA